MTAFYCDNRRPTSPDLLPVSWSSCSCEILPCIFVVIFFYKRVSFTCMLLLVFFACVCVCRCFASVLFFTVINLPSVWFPLTVTVGYECHSDWGHVYVLLSLVLFNSSYYCLCISCKHTNSVHACYWNWWYVSTCFHLIFSTFLFYTYPRWHQSNITNIICRLQIHVYLSMYKQSESAKELYRCWYILCWVLWYG